MIDPRLRQFSVTGGRVRPPSDLPLATPISTTGLPAGSRAPEYTDIVDRCRTPQTVVDLSSALGSPVGVIRVLVLDLADAGVLTVHDERLDLAPHLDLNLLEEALDGIANL